MASSARIDELRKKFDENPRRYFAPLANEYRKVGDLDQAIFICQEYLPQQPGHMSGHIVYAQTLYEMGRHDEATAVFETALALDPENLIALRHLGDIACQAGDSNAARVWYQRALEADPRNEEIAQIMISLLAEPATTAPPPTPSVPLSTPLLTPAVPLAALPESAPKSWAMEPAENGTESGLEVEKSMDTHLAAAPAAPTAQPSAAAPPDEYEGGHEWLDLKDLTIGGVAMGTEHDEDAEKPTDAFAPGREPERSAEILSESFVESFADSFAEPFTESFDEPESPMESSAESHVESLTSSDVHHDDAVFDLGGEDGPFEADPFAIAATPEKLYVTNAVEPLVETPGGPPVETAVVTAADAPSAMGDDAKPDAHVHDETPDAVDGLEEFEAGFIPSAPPAPRLDTEPFSHAPLTPIGVSALSEPPVGLDAVDAIDMPSPVSEAPGVEAPTVEDSPHESPGTGSLPIEPPEMEATAWTPAEPPDNESTAVAFPETESSADEPTAEPPAAELPVVESNFVEPAFAESAASAPAHEATRVDDIDAPAHVEEAFVTETMADLYLRQGHHESAIDIYRKLVEQRPTDHALRERLHAVEAQVFDQSVGFVDAPEGAREPASAVATAPEAEQTMDASAGPTIREFLMGLTGRLASNELGQIDEASALDTDEMAEATQATDIADAVAATEGTFAADVPAQPDAYGATALSAGDALQSASASASPTRRAAANPGVTVSGSIDALFSDADASAADTSAAATLAEAFAPESIANVPLQGVPAHRAANELSLDHVFKSTAPPRSDVETDGFSFDQFFAGDMSDPAPSATGDAGTPSPDAADDIAQFNAWLNGLKKT